MAIHTVLGPIAQTDLGLTSMHEHLLLDCRVLHVEPASAPPFGDRVCIENLGWLRWNNQSLLDNLVVDDPDVVASGLEAFVGAGGSGIVDMTNIGLGRRVGDLPAIAHRSGAHVMVGCGWYLAPSHPPDAEAAAVEDLAAILIDELTTGIGDTGIRPALIGEIGTGAPVTAREWKVLVAAAWAAAETGAAINVHVQPEGTHGREIADLLVAEGAPADRVVLSHMDERLDLDYHLSVLDAGVLAEFDTFGNEAYWDPPFRDPTDNQRCAALADLVERGHADQLVLGCDVYTKTCHTAWGGQGYEHLPLRIVPMLREAHGITDEQLEMMLIGTPRRVLDRP